MCLSQLSLLMLSMMLVLFRLVFRLISVVVVANVDVIVVVVDTVGVEPCVN